MATIDATVLTFTGAIQHRRGTSETLKASDYIPAAGEILIATDTGEIKAGNGTDTWKDLPSYNRTEIVNDYEQTDAGRALDAMKGKDLNDRLTAFEGITGIDCGEITAAEHEGD